MGTCRYAATVVMSGLAFLTHFAALLTITWTHAQSTSLAPVSFSAAQGFVRCGMRLPRHEYVKSDAGSRSSTLGTLQQQTLPTFLRNPVCRISLLFHPDKLPLLIHASLFRKASHGGPNLAETAYRPRLVSLVSTNLRFVVGRPHRMDSLGQSSL